MNPGAPTDIMSGLPVEKIAADKTARDAALQEENLKTKTAFLGMTSTDAGQTLITLVQQHLTRRINELVTQDPPAQALLKILADMDLKEFEATRAAERLVAMRMNVKK
jgi:hypothetical protein